MPAPTVSEVEMMQFRRWLVAVALLAGGTAALGLVPPPLMDGEMVEVDGLAGAVSLRYLGASVQKVRSGSSSFEWTRFAYGVAGSERPTVYVYVGPGDVRDRPYRTTYGDAYQSEMLYSTMVSENAGKTTEISIGGFKKAFFTKAGTEPRMACGINNRAMVLCIVSPGRTIAARGIYALTIEEMTLHLRRIAGR